jgi:hypothetical protein
MKQNKSVQIQKQSKNKKKTFYSPRDPPATQAIFMNTDKKNNLTTKTPLCYFTDRMIPETIEGMGDSAADTRKFFNSFSRPGT